MIECVASGAWGGWVEEALGRRSLPGARALAAGFDPHREGLSVEAFPGRWNPRRALPREIEPLALAAARALERGGWWLPGSGASSRGGLIVGCDGGPLACAIEFAREVAGGSARAPSPTGFLFSLPSTAASVLGLLFGLSEYQATVAQGPLSGVRALGHAVDLLELGRLDRVLVAALSVAEGDQAAALPESAGRTARLSAAVCLERRASPGGRDETGDAAERGAGLEVAIEAGAGGDRAPAEGERCAPAPVEPQDLPGCFGHLAAVPLVRLVAWLEEARRGPDQAETTIHVRDPRLGEEGWIALKKRNEASWPQATR